MTKTVEISYLGELRTKCLHLESGSEIYTDAPKDNHGFGQNFSPTDLLATSLGSCMLTIMGIASNTHGIDIQGTKVLIKKHMSATPRKVSQLDIEIMLPHNDYHDKELQILELAARTCPVSLSLHPNLVQNIIFVLPK